ncbi:MAG: hypothetical protein JNM27_08560 [Leptospirales bacterium]|nr:hypothetical protein [Leptospirales bacterium]
MKRRLIFIFLALTLLSSCYAKPNEVDATRVKQEFMNMRFQSPLNPEYASMTDRQLFELACRSKRVKCDKVLEIIKEKDPEFFVKLNPGAGQ